MIRRCINNYRYLTCFDKPVTSLAINSIVQLTSETLQYFHQQFGIVPQLSVVMGAFAFRVGLEFLGLFFESLNMRRKDTWIHRWIQKIFLVDLQRDCTFYELSSQQYKALAQYYKPEQLFTFFLKNYTILNFFRGCYSISIEQSLQSFCLSSLGSLSLHDPFFILPIPVILINYLILSHSKHPFLIHLVRKENKLMCLNIAFMTGLLFVAVPSVFPLGYIGLGLAHLTIRKGRHRANEWKEWFYQITKKTQKKKD